MNWLSTHILFLPIWGSLILLAESVKPQVHFVCVWKGWDWSWCYCEEHKEIKRYSVSLCVYRGLATYHSLPSVECWTNCLLCVFSLARMSLGVFLSRPRKINQFTDSCARKYLATNTPVKDTIELIALIMKVFWCLPHFWKLRVNLESSWQNCRIEQDETLCWSQTFKPS